MLPLASRALEIEPFRVMDILARARAMEAAGRSVIHLEVGEPDFATPEPIVAAGIVALRAGLTHYTPALGLPDLRAAIARYYGERHGIDLSPARVAVTPGASGALLLAVAALFDRGEQVLLSDPGYPCNRHFVRLLEAEPVGIPVGADSRFQLTAELVRRHWGPRTRGVLVANPGNPTGTLIDPAELQAIAAWVRERDGWLIVDEIYHELVYGQDPPCALGLGDRVVVINSFSKYWLMTGWRLGWLVGPEALMPALDRLAQNIFLCAPTVAQHAALAALGPETRSLLEARKAELRRRRDWLLPELRRLGFTPPVEPDGAFYAYAEIGHWAEDGERLAGTLLEERGVAITPGADFGRHAAGRHVRFAYTTSLENIRTAVQRMQSGPG